MQSSGGSDSSDETRRLRFVLETIGKTEWPGRKVQEYAAILERHNRKALEDDDSGLVL